MLRLLASSIRRSFSRSGRPCPDRWCNQKKCPRSETLSSPEATADRASRLPRPESGGQNFAATAASCEGSCAKRESCDEQTINIQEESSASSHYGSLKRGMLSRCIERRKVASCLVPLKKIVRVCLHMAGLSLTPVGLELFMPNALLYHTYLSV